MNDMNNLTLISGKGTFGCAGETKLDLSLTATLHKTQLLLRRRSVLRDSREGRAENTMPVN